MLYNALMMFLIAQVGKGPTKGPGDAEAACGALGFGCFCGCAIVSLLMFLPMILGAWKAFTKAGEPGVAAIVPIWNALVFLKIAGKEPIRLLFYLIPVANIYFIIVDHIDFAKAYGKEAGFGLGLYFLSPIFWPILGFGSAKYIGPPGGGSSAGRSARRPAAGYEDEEEPPRRRRRTEDEY